MSEPIMRALVAEALPEIILIGGPRDGERDIRTRPLPKTLRLSAIGPVGILSGYQPFGPKPIPIAIYEMIETDGLPSLDDAGRFRYQYREES